MLVYISTGGFIRSLARQLLESPANSAARKRIKFHSGNIFCHFVLIRVTGSLQSYINSSQGREANKMFL